MFGGQAVKLHRHTEGFHYLLIIISLSFIFSIKLVTNVRAGLGKRTLAAGSLVQREAH